MADPVETEEGEIIDAVFNRPGFSAALAHFKEDMHGYIEMLRKGEWDLEDDNEINRLFERGYEYGLYRGKNDSFDGYTKF